jgi:23S rRNA U2552 (ribose-2'-O)-methylase RlmE/FtsJ
MLFERQICVNKLWSLVLRLLEPGGVFIGKFFSGPEEQELKVMALQDIQQGCNSETTGES